MLAVCVAAEHFCSSARWSRALPSAIIRIPATAIRLLMGESSVLVLGGRRALPKRRNRQFAAGMI